MYAWEQIQQTVDYIDKHLGEELAIDNLAEMASLSPFYYQRLFKRLVKKPVGEYIKLRRMGKATEALLQKDSRILDIALELGFTSHEHFTRTFKETFGMTPEEYRRNPTTLNRMTKPELSLNYVLVEEGVPLVTEGIVIEDMRALKRKCRLPSWTASDATPEWIPLDSCGTTCMRQRIKYRALWRAERKPGLRCPAVRKGFSVILRAQESGRTLRL